MKSILISCLIVFVQSLTVNAEPGQDRVAQGLLIAKTYYVDGHYASCLNELAIIRKVMPQSQNVQELEGLCKKGTGDFVSIHDFWNVRAGDSLDKFKSLLVSTHSCKAEADKNYPSDFVYYNCVNAAYGAQSFSFFQGKLRRFSASVFKDIWNPTFRESLAKFANNTNGRPYKYELDGPVAECENAKCKAYVFKKGNLETSLITTESGMPVKYNQVDNATMDASIRALASFKAKNK